MPKIARPTKPLADVNVLPALGSLEVVACFMPDPDVLVGEGQSRAALAIDASRSLKPMYGGGIFGTEPNYVELVARKLGGILTGVVRSGKVSIFYWALGPGGAKTEVVGEFDEAGCASATISGPRSPKDWGTGTQLLPAIRQIAETIAAGADWTMGVIITDGIIEDEEASMNYCMQLGREIDAGKRKDLKLILIGVGEEVDAGQLERFDDMFEGTDLEDKVDLWSHGIAASMRDEGDIIAVLFGELMTEEIIVAPSGSVLDDKGNEVASFSDGLPGKFRFKLPKGCKAFTVHTPRGDVTQDITEAVS